MNRTVKKTKVKITSPEVIEAIAASKKVSKEVVLPITQEFGGDMNILRDKINEIIAKQ